jgi:excinuclease ABC subunit C
MIDANGDLIYVGKAKSLRARLLGYFRPNSRQDKAEKIITDTSRLIWEIAPSEFSALLRELELIRRWQPCYNVQGQPRRQRRCYIGVGRRPAPCAFVSTKIPSTAIACFGPFAGVARTRDAVRRLNDWYRLRDCPQKQTMIFSDQTELFPVLRTPACIRHDIGHCLAPCAAACSRQDYAFHVQGALDFLQGKDKTPLDQLEHEMNAAAGELHFERAAVLRDRLDVLQWLFDHLERLRQAVQYSCVYPVTNHDGSRTWYLIRNGLVRAALPAPVDDQSRQRMASILDEMFRASCSGPPGIDEIDGVLLVASWFRRHRDQRKLVLSVESARAAIRLVRA